MGVTVHPSGIVYRPVGYTGEKVRVFWARCPICGPQPPTTELLAYRSERMLEMSHRRQGEGTVGCCSVCLGDAPIREVVVPLRVLQDATGSTWRGPCNRRCTEGRATCSCRCVGRCHGEGRCYCGEHEGGKE